ncbi:unnamed protein product [Rotaria magnacalcarata]|uniref:Shisa N-terminal domain-containing protein n=1 Tax=Rotaria magnacalcarata TaxID=392030 RepID=A0A816SSW7_9BILA|nr:unnamed protein product [Rotaria magnacalcarata]CAF1493694.1 unnamed protein product [Rotaria magnacalcarata]CAF2078816.1 unnamed protein product [Rotaria magnacalcarata]CAF2085006.1 unnamed protein product [Rotaria magnacalcarata]CAF2087120.1 unnamed protein product [Rotaria magnacalcarata]
MTTSCPGFLDRYGIWNNGFDCSLSRICCGTDTDRFCCIPTTTLNPLSSSSYSTRHPSFDDLDSYVIPTSNSLLNEKWVFIQLCTIGLFLAIVLLIFVIIYLCFISMRCGKRRKKMSIIEVSLPTRSPSLIESKRSTSNRISTISSTSSDGKSRCTDISMVLNTPLNLYPTNSRASTVASSYYLYPNELEYLCK